MIFEKSIFEKAMFEIKRNRILAESLSERHREEILKKIPAIGELLEELAQACIKLSTLIIEKNGDLNSRLKEIQDSNLFAQEQIKSLLRENGYAADYLQPKYSCEICFDRGFNEGKRCKCLTNLINKLSVDELNKNSQIKLSTFESFKLDYYPQNDINGVESYQQMSKIFKYCKNYVDTFSLNSKSVFMLGMTGLGKTHLSLAIAKEVIEKGYNVAYDSIVNYLRMIEKEHFGRADTDTLQLILNVDLLILDDLGTEFDSGFYNSCVYNIINTRLNRGVPTIISTNLTLPQLQSKYDDRIVSRLLAMYDYFRFAGNDIRQIKKINGEL